MTWIGRDPEMLCRWLFTTLEAQRTRLLSTNGTIGLALALCIQSVTWGKQTRSKGFCIHIQRIRVYLENNTNNNYKAV